MDLIYLNIMQIDYQKFKRKITLKFKVTISEYIVCIFLLQLEFLHTEETGKPLGDSWIAKLLVFVHRECE